MQSRGERSPRLRRHQSAGLQFPTLSDDSDIDTWLEHSSVISEALRPSMASHLDDNSSMDEALSSVGASTWDLIDEGSVASEDVAYNPPRRHGPASDVMESVHVTNQSFVTMDRGSPMPEDWDLENIMSNDVRSDDAEDPKDAVIDATSQVVSPTSYNGDFSHGEGWTDTVRVTQTLRVDTRRGIEYAYAKAVDFEPEEAAKALSARKIAENVIPVCGRVHLSLGEGGLEVKDTFKLLYYGPKEMKSAITQKIGSALAANPRRPMINDGPGSSRVTVVPISSIVDESSPEVVMIESGGFDMIIEECVRAYLNPSGGITLEVESGNTIEQTLDSEVPRTSRLSTPTGVPDLGILYIPEKSSTKAKLWEEIMSQNLYYVQLFFIRLGLPCCVITDRDWLDQPEIPIIQRPDLTPHRTVEAMIDGKKQTLSTLPIDITTFLALDASQLHQNLVALKSCRLKPHQRRLNRFVACREWLKESLKQLSVHCYDTPRIFDHVSAWTLLSMGLVLFAVALGFVLVKSESTAVQTHPEALVAGEKFLQTKLQAISTLHKSHTQVGLQVASTPKAVADFISADSLPSSLRSKKRHDKKTGKSKSTTSSKDSPKILVKLVGNSHVLIKSSRSSSGQDWLNFQTTRNDKLLEHSVQKIDNEYCVLEIPPAEAYGLIKIHVRTVTKPMYNETFEIDLGSPLLKINGWKDLAESAVGRAASEARILQSSLSKMLKDSGAAISALRQNEDIPFAINRIKKSLRSLGTATGNRSQRLLVRSIRRTLKMRKRTMKALLQLQYIGTKQSEKVREQQSRLNADMAQLFDHIATTLSRQMHECNRTLRGFRQATQHSVYTRSMQTQVRRVQKKLLQTWWKVRGRPHKA